MFVNGELAGAHELMMHNVEAVRTLGARKIVTTCPSCFYFWKHAYPAALGVDDLHAEVLHATEFLADLLESGAVPLREIGEDVTYHDPCDLGRKGGITEAPRRILSQIPGVRLLEMVENRESSYCCGGGGNLETYAPQMGKAVSRSRIQQAAQAGARTVVSACQQCERTLSSAARSERLPLRVKDIVEVVLEALE
jgi:heterodisulfide reductase subunit D